MQTLAIHDFRNPKVRTADRAARQTGDPMATDEASWCALVASPLAEPRPSRYEYTSTKTSMSLDGGSITVKLEAPFLHVRPGHFVIVGGDHVDQGEWWMGQVLFCEGSARHPKMPSLFQVADVDSGIIKWINADEVTDVIWSMDGWPVSTTIQEKS